MLEWNAAHEEEEEEEKEEEELTASSSSRTVRGAAEVLALSLPVAELMLMPEMGQGPQIMGQAAVQAGLWLDQACWQSPWGWVACLVAGPPVQLLKEGRPGTGPAPSPFIAARISVGTTLPQLNAHTVACGGI